MANITSPDLSSVGQGIQQSPLAEIFNNQNKLLRNIRSHEVDRDISGRIVDQNSPTGLDWLQQNGPFNPDHAAITAARYAGLGRATQTQAPSADQMQAMHPGMNFGHPSQNYGLDTPYGTASVHQLGPEEYPHPATITNPSGQTYPMKEWFAHHPDTSNISTKISGSYGIGNLNTTNSSNRMENILNAMELPQADQTKMGMIFSNPPSALDNYKQKESANIASQGRAQTQADQAAIKSLQQVGKPNPSAPPNTQPSPISQVLNSNPSQATTGIKPQAKPGKPVPNVTGTSGGIVPGLDEIKAWLESLSWGTHPY